MSNDGQAGRMTTKIRAFMNLAKNRGLTAALREWSVRISLRRSRDDDRSATFQALSRRDPRLDHDHYSASGVASSAVQVHGCPWDFNLSSVVRCGSAVQKSSRYRLAARSDYQTLDRMMLSEAGDEPSELFAHKTATNVLRDLIFALGFTMVHGNRSSLFQDYITILVEGSALTSGSALVLNLTAGFNSLYNEGLQLANFFIQPTQNPIYWLPGLSIEISYRAKTINDYSGYFAFALHRKPSNPGFDRSDVRYCLLLWIAVGVYNRRIPVARGLRSGVLWTDSCSWPPVIKLGLTDAPVPIFNADSLFRFFDMNPAHKSPMSKVTGRVDLLQCILKTALLIVWAATDNMLIKIGAAFFVPTTMIAATLFYFPYYSLRLNQIVSFLSEVPAPYFKLRAALYGGAAGAGLIASIWAVNYSYTGTFGSSDIVIIMGVAYIVFSVGCYWSCGHVYRRIQASVELALGALNSDLRNPEADLIFIFWPHVEIAARLTT
ncbi:hypothetical protein BDK51DRAFT_37693, partial [Blyttiomyces helicus]